MSRRSESTARTRLRDHIHVTVRSFITEPTPSTVIDRFMERVWRTLFPRDEPVVREGFIEGLGRMVRAEMHAQAVLQGDTSILAEPVQLELWAEDEREFARQIGVASFYVPSRQTYVPLHDRGRITNAELAEGIEHLRKYARALDHRALWGDLLLKHREGQR